MSANLIYLLNHILLKMSSIFFKKKRFGSFQEGGVYIPQAKAWGLDTEGYDKNNAPFLSLNRVLNNGTCAN